MSFRYFDNIRIGQLISRIVSDIAEIRELVFLGPNYLLVCTITMLGTLGILIYLNWPLALLVNLLLLGKAYESVATNHALKQSGRMIREQVGNLTAQTNESLNAIRLVKSFNNEEWEEKRLDKNGQALLQARKTSFDLLSRLNSNAVLFSNVTNLVIIVVGGAMIAYGILSEQADEMLSRAEAIVAADENVESYMLRYNSNSGTITAYLEDDRKGK